MAESEEAEDDTPPDTMRRFPFSLKRIGEFIARVWRVERDVASLTKRCEKIEERTEALQRQLDNQTGQLKQLAAFVHQSIDQRIDIQAEKAARQFFEQVLIASQEPAPKRRVSKRNKKPRN